ncbi:MAG: hypothetical protein U9R08_05820 [Nanoarchaeota archaeon]|nr:hypothetical protein [Nanoarchaeota archaeon]
MEALRIFKRALFFKRYKQYNGNAVEICKQIVKNCWNGKFFQASRGHFNQFYTRDFALCVEGLLKSGYKKEVKKTLEYALQIFEKNRKVTTTITPKGKAIDIFSYTPESIAMIIRSLRIVNDKKLIHKYKRLINNEVNKAFKISFNKKTGLLRIDKYFSSMKDNSLRKGSCYNNCMIAMLSNDLKRLKLNNPFKKYNIKENIRKKFWNGKYFYDDIRKGKYVAGDANIFPFWTKVFDDKKMFQSCLNEIKKAGLDKPWPLKYTNFRTNQRFPNNIVVPNYEGNSVWTQLGLCFMKTVKMYNYKDFKKYYQQYSELIENNKNLIELFNPDGSVYKTTFYIADESLIWAAIFLEISLN